MVPKQKPHIKGIIHVKTEVGVGSTEAKVSPVKAKKEKYAKTTNPDNPFNFTSNFFSNVSVGYDILLHTFQYLKVQVIIFTTCLNVKKKQHNNCKFTLGAVTMYMCLSHVGTGCESYHALENRAYEELNGE